MSEQSEDQLHRLYMMFLNGYISAHHDQDEAQKLSMAAAQKAQNYFEMSEKDDEKDDEE